MAKQEQPMNDQLRVRREKMQELRDNGMDPFGHRFERTHLAAEIHAAFDAVEHDDLLAQENEVTISGRMVSKRGKGKVGFADILDKSGRNQVY